MDGALEKGGIEGPYEGANVGRKEGCAEGPIVGKAQSKILNIVFLLIILKSLSYLGLMCFQK